MCFVPVDVVIGFFMEVPVVSVRNGSGGDFTCHVILDARHGVIVEDNFVTLVHRSFIVEISKTVRIELVRQVGRTGITETVVVVHRHLSSLTFLGGNQNHTKSCTRTVDGRRGSVFQYGDAFNIFRVQSIHISFHTVNQDKRFTL